MLRYAIAEFQEIGWLPGADNLAYDVTGTFPADGVPATLVRGLVNITPSMSWLELVAWVLYVGITLTAFLVVIRRSAPRPKSATVPSTASSVTTR